ncbi:(E)-4-hydroxy-3-methyl-but-2-enyl pyrophosphate reductase [Desulfitobacterium dichloroeliminans LMG P-21439]|uniref:4-hydroxy-3-methylbut-2-enyl diphosphate reductase n=1 Tax=Desulfitobacterium dichloroeliminans (strain LMG P-21439 / DCA1) TaxID=871963 RepID=L0F9R1_DESDL|nr:bifunctional 4-hydroxy-3-methylbut-2-enyl diphosphate reductase/30S ribosomal protein S1 [Desulfitobacterium dichloroeliminans]AGA69765.1 (E)-4-hydroxy-3-methyl-but-2-enyl pyrophosphate reductase [Desulfitobacterium dichloroeliminans LMG P-21439]
MKIIRAEKAGFCFGVKRALDMAERTVLSSSTASLGPLIHNKQVVEKMEKQGVRVVGEVKETEAGDTLIIRSHGVPPDIYQEAQRLQVEVVDATCPFVQKAQRLAAEASKTSQVIVVGDRQHPEVQGILGWAGVHSIAIEKLEEASELPFYEKLSVLAQTTQPAANFHSIVDELRKHTKELKVHNTICNATEERQTVARELAGKVDVMIVVGGKNSANTRKLAGICSEHTQTYLIETADELENNWFKGVETVGLTAGASTPDWIIEEVNKKMSNMENNEMNEIMNMEDWAAGMQSLHRGALVKGTVVKVTHDEVFVDLGWKSEGIIPLKELTVSSNVQPSDIVAVGDEIQAVVLRVENEEGNPLLSKRRADEFAAADRLKEYAETKQEIQGKVAEVVKGGLIVDVGMRGFVPASQIQPGYVEDLNQFKGQTLRLRVIEFDPSKRRVVLSQKEILQEELAVKKEQLLGTLQEGDVISGTVKRLAQFGAFIDLGGVDGLLHVSDIAYTRIKHPSEYVNVGDEVEVQVLKVDKEQGKISLGLKQLKPSPWENALEKYPVGALVTGKVVRLAPFGAFVQLEDGVDALVHISQLSEKRVNKVEDIVTVGDMVQAKIIECKPEEKRISLSIREAAEEAQATEDAQLLADQPEAPQVTIGDVIQPDSES